MNREELIMEVVKAVQEKLPDNKIEYRPVTKNNGVKLDGISVFFENNLSANVYINEGLDKLMTGDVTIDDVAREVVWQFRNSSTNTRDILGGITKVEDVFKDKAGFLNRVRKELVSKNMNTEDIEHYPHKDFCDLMVVYRVVLTESASFLVRDVHMDYANVTIEELEQAADKNGEYVQENLIEVIKRIAPSCFVPTDDIGLNILTTKNMMWGASAMTDKEFLKTVAEGYDNDFYIIPSSIHECITVPVSTEMPLKAIASMVREVNSKEVAPEEVLSDNVYIYRRETNEVSIAA